MLSSHCAHQEIWLGSIQTGNSAEVTRASRAVANHRSMQRTSPGPWGPKRTGSEMLERAIETTTASTHTIGDSGLEGKRHL
jgi:hypothetical protein